MTFRTSMLIVAAAAAASWALPGAGSQQHRQVAHEFLTHPVPSAAAQVEPVQLAMLVQAVR